MAKKKTTTDLHETWILPDIPEVLYPTYLYSESGKLFNLKAVIYPSPTSRKKFTRRKQLLCRSAQAKIFDAIINIGYFNPLTVWTEFPIIIRNEWRLSGQTGSYYLLDYFFPDLRLAVELDSDYHDSRKDQIRDDFLKKQFGIDTVRITDLHKPSVQKRDFPELAKLMRERGDLERPIFNFQNP